MLSSDYLAATNVSTHAVTAGLKACGYGKIPCLLLENFACRASVKEKAQFAALRTSSAVAKSVVFGVSILVADTPCQTNANVLKDRFAKTYRIGSTTASRQCSP